MENDTRTLNIQSDSDDARSRMLSNFAAVEFMLDGITCSSVEGFLMGIMFPREHPNHLNAFKLAGKAAKKLGKEATRWYAWWDGRTMDFRSNEHLALIERAIRAKFLNEEAEALLHATRGMKLIHDIGRLESPTTCLPAEVLCDVLTRIRDDLPPRYPGSKEHPVDVVTTRELTGCGFQSHATWHGMSCEHARADTASEAVGLLISSLASAHPIVHVRIKRTEF